MSYRTDVFSHIETMCQSKPKLGLTHGLRFILSESCEKEQLLLVVHLPLFFDLCETDENSCPSILISELILWDIDWIRSGQIPIQWKESKKRHLIEVFLGARESRGVRNSPKGSCNWIQLPAEARRRLQCFDLPNDSVFSCSVFAQLRSILMCFGSIVSNNCMTVFLEQDVRVSLQGRARYHRLIAEKFSETSQSYYYAVSQEK